MTEIKYIQYVVIPKKPRMSKGKIASQSCHASFMALENQKGNDKLLGCDERKRTSKLIENWKESGMCVIVLQCENEIKLHGIAKYLKQWKIPHHLYIDEGLYGCKPFTSTALATGVLTEEQFWIFKEMRLFK